MPWKSYAQNTPYKIAIVVNGSPISEYDIQSRMQLYVALRNLTIDQNNASQIRDLVIRRLIDEHLIRNLAQEANIALSKQELDSHFTSFANKLSTTPQELNAYLISKGLNTNLLYQRLEIDALWKIYIVQRYGQQITIHDDEVMAAFRLQRETEQGAFDNAVLAQASSRYRLAEIVTYIPTDGNAEQLFNTLERATATINTHDDFIRAVHTYSEVPSVQKDGDIGWFNASDLPPFIRSRLEPLQIGEITPPIRIDDRFVVITLLDKMTVPPPKQEERLPNQTVQLRQIYVPIPETASSEIRQRYVQQTITNTADLTGCEAFRQAERTVGSSHSGSLGYVQLSSLAPDVRTLVRTLPIGTPSPPIETNEAIIVFMVCDRTIDKVTPTPVADSTLPTDAQRAAIKNNIFQERLGIYADQEMHTLRQSSIIEHL